MKWRAILGFFFGVAVTFAGTAEPHAQSASMPVIGFLNSGSATGRANFVAAFRRGLREQGFIEGQNVAIEFRWANDQYDQLPILAADLVSRKVNVIAAIGLAAPGLAAKAATSTIPIVFQTGSDPVKDGLVSSISRPGANVTGLLNFITGLEAKRLGLLHEMTPKSGDIAILLNRRSVALETQLQDLQEAARALGRSVRVLYASNVNDIDLAFESIGKERSVGLLVASDVFFNSQHGKIVTLANRLALPTIYAARFYAAVGGLMSYGIDLVDGYRQSGIYVGRVLKGEKPAEMPVLQTAKFEFVLNLKAAKELDLTVPSGILSIVDEVIE
jgi:putative ABC transport system substrate-binding protein